MSWKYGGIVMMMRGLFVMCQHPSPLGIEPLGNISTTPRWHFASTKPTTYANIHT